MKKKLNNDIKKYCGVENETIPQDTLDKPIKRGRGRPKKENKIKGATGNYFAPVEKYLMDYINSNDEFERNIIFKKHLYDPMYFMIQTILMRYYNNKFAIDESVDDIINDAFSFIVTKLDRFDAELGYKAYSYIQTVIKHYIGSKYQNYDKRIKRYSPMDEVYQDVKDQVVETDENGNEIKNSGFINELIIQTVIDIEECIKNSEKHNLNEKDCNVGNCLIQLLNDWENIIGDVGSHKFNKNIIFSFIAESTFLDIKTIRVSIKKYKAIYQNSKRNFLNIY